MVRHRVEDFDAWKRVFDESAEIRRNAGCVRSTVYRDPRDARHVMVIHRMVSPDAVHRITHSATVVDAMARAGVKVAPEFTVYEEIDEQTYG